MVGSLSFLVVHWFSFVVEGLSSLKMVRGTLGYFVLGPPPGLHKALEALYGPGCLIRRLRAL